MNQKKVFFAIFLLLTIGISTQLQPAFRSLQARALTYDPRQFVKAGEEPDEPVKVNAQNKYRLSALKQVVTKAKSLPEILKKKNPNKVAVPFEFPTLVEWSARCQSAYPENTNKDSSPGDFAGEPCLSSTEFNMALDLFLQKFEDKGIFEQWVGLDLPGTKAAPDFKYPYVTKLDGETGNICCFIGDLHGDVHSLLRTLWRLGALGFIDKNFKITKKNFYLIFLGDYVDRGRYGAEVFYTLMRLKCAKWGQVYLNRGNHEVKGMNERRAREGGGFRNELEIKYQEESDNLFAKICDIYQRLPLSVYITANGETVQAVHAGFGPYNYYYDKQMKQLMTQKNKRYRHIPLEDMDLISPAYQWCDVSQQMHVGAQNIFREDNGRVWNIDIATLVKRLEQVGIRALFRGHQHGSYGLKMLFSPAEYLRLADKESSVDKSSSHYHWSRVLSAEDIAANRLGGGFKISKYMPLFTFSSSPEGVGELYDCFGLLFIDGLYDDWRLKVYEFETAHDDVSYTSISPAMRRLPTTGTGDVLDPVRVTFNNEPEAEEKLKKSLDRIGTQQELIE